eukprot:scaffold44_cov411-Prasinococcus_capsulatus_cf.AAC.4
MAGLHGGGQVHVGVFPPRAWITPGPQARQGRGPGPGHHAKTWPTLSKAGFAGGRRRSGVARRGRPSRPAAAGGEPHAEPRGAPDRGPTGQ